MEKPALLYLKYRRSRAQRSFSPGALRGHPRRRLGEETVQLAPHLGVTAEPRQRLGAHEPRLG